MIVLTIMNHIQVRDFSYPYLNNNFNFLFHYLLDENLTSSNTVGVIILNPDGQT